MPADPRRVKELFGVLVLVDPSDRPVLLDRECADDAELRRRLDALLRAHDHPESALERPLAVDPDRTIDRRTAAVGSIVAGKYKLLEELGEGGMGEVWVADQLEPVKRRVALKMIKPGMDSRSILARFEAERQALAMMDHPNIAKVFDAGATDDGRPYFAMELVKGTPITEFCDARKLGFRERLELFVPICHAIQHAHQKGVIHRDIKPGNVLVALHDERPVPKVIDFGVAKAVGQQLTEKTVYTGFGVLVGTPAYMAPEQATFNQLDVDTRADVYSLGVLLYELLAGSPPFEPERLRKVALDEVLRLVREEEPQRPSARLSTSESKATIAAVRRSDPRQLATMMKGELDWIVMKSLEKDRTRRYDTVAGLARDVERYLKDEPVEACPPTLGYRLRKSYRKNRAAVGVAAAILGLVCGAAVLATVLALQARRAEELAKRNEENANANASIAADALAEANHARQGVMAARDNLRRAHYATSMNLAQAAWESDNVPRVVELLEEQRPKPGEADLRGFEWHYWDRLTHADLRTWRFHSGGELIGATLSADSRRIGSWAFDETDGRTTFRIRVQDATTGQELFATTLPRGDTLAFVQDGRLAFSRDGRRIAFTHRIKDVNRPTRRVTVFDVDAGKEIVRKEGLFAPDTALSPDGSRLAIVVRNDENSPRRPTDTWTSVSIWNLGKLDEQPVRIENEDSAAALVAPNFSPDGNRLAAVTWKGRQNSNEFASEFRIWNATTGASELRQPTVGDMLIAAAFRPDGRYLASVGLKAPGEKSKDMPKAYVTLWRIGVDGKLAAVHSTYVPHVITSVPHLNFAFSADGKRLALANTFQPALILDLDTGSTLRSIKSVTGIVASAFSPDGSRLRTIRNAAGNQPTAIPDGTLQEWDATPAAPPSTDPRKWFEVWNRDRSRQISFDWLKQFDIPGRPVIVVKDGAGKELRVFAKHASQMHGAVFSPDGRWVLSHSADDAILWSVETGEVGWSRKGTGDGRFLAQDWDANAFSPDGRWIALRDADDTRIVAAADLKERMRTGPASHVRFSPDGRRLVAFRPGPPAEDHKPKTGELKFWNLETNELIETVPWSEGHAWPAVFTPDGRLFGVAGQKTVTVFDSATGKLQCSMKPEPQLGRLVFSPDGTRMVMVRKEGFGRYGDGSGTDPIAIWDTATGKPVAHLKGHPSPIRDVVFSPDGRRIATAGSPVAGIFGEVRIWDAATGRGLLTLPCSTGFFGEVRLAFSPDGHRLSLRLAKASQFRDPEQTWDATPRAEGKP